jgi:glutathione S-transferase
MQKKVPQSVGEAFALIESEFDGPWVLGGRYSICDIYLFTLAQWLEADGVDPAQFPGVEDHRTRMRQDPSVAKIVAAEAPGG